MPFCSTSGEHGALVAASPVASSTASAPPTLLPTGATALDMAALVQPGTAVAPLVTDGPAATSGILSPGAGTGDATAAVRTAGEVTALPAPAATRLPLVVVTAMFSSWWSARPECDAGSSGPPTAELLRGGFRWSRGVRVR